MYCRDVRTSNTVRPLFRVPTQSFVWFLFDTAGFRESDRRTMVYLGVINRWYLWVFSTVYEQHERPEISGMICRCCCSYNM